MLREAVHTVTLAVLAAGGTTSRTVLEAAVATVRDAGLDDCTQEQLFTVVEVMAADTGRGSGADPAAEACGPTLAIELHEVLAPLAPTWPVPAASHVLLLQGARIALADGPYCAAERQVLTTVGSALGIPAEETARVLAEAARTPS